MRKKKALNKPKLPIGQLPGLLNQKGGAFRKDKTIYRRKQKHIKKGEE